MAITPITITFGGSTGVLNPDGSQSSGSITFQLSGPMEDSSTGEVVTTEPIIGEIISGQLVASSANHPPLQLLANTDATTVPAGTYYIVTEELTDGSLPPWNLYVKHDAVGATMDLTSQRPVP